MGECTREAEKETWGWREVEGGGVLGKHAAGVAMLVEAGLNRIAPGNLPCVFSPPDAPLDHVV